MAPDWGISERYDPQIIGASFMMPVATNCKDVRQPDDGSLEPRLLPRQVQGWQLQGDEVQVLR